MTMCLILAVFWVTAIVIPIAAILSVAYVTFWRRRGRPGATRRAVVFGIVFALAVLANPLLNHIILFPLCGNGVSRMLNDLKSGQFVGKSRSELVARFGKPSIQRTIPGAQEEFIFTCRPWFYWSYPEGVCVNVSEGTVASFAYYH